jgi:hypothetical protein
MKITDDLVKAAIEIHLSSHIRSRGSKFRELFPEIDLQGTREVYAVVDKVMDLAWKLCSESLADNTITEASAVKQITAAFPEISEQTAKDVVNSSFTFRGKM